MNIDSIRKGIVLDHIKAGKAMEIYHHLNLDELTCTVAIIKNVKSKLMGKKDIIKIDDDININLDVLGFIDPYITVNIIDEEKCVEKRKVALPKRVTNIAKCKNPRCITSVETDIPHICKLVDEEKRIYRCIYCETQVQKN